MPDLTFRHGMKRNSNVDSIPLCVCPDDKGHDMDCRATLSSPPPSRRKAKKGIWMDEWKTSKTSLVTPINNKRRETNLRAKPSIAACDNMGEFYKNKPPASQKSPWWQLVRIHIHPLSAKPHPNPIRQKSFGLLPLLYCRLGSPSFFGE